jgi:hypothetical protein
MYNKNSRCSSVNHFYNLPEFTGGVSICVLTSYSNTEIVESFEFENSDVLMLKLEDVPLIIAGIYEPPDADVSRFLCK